MIDYSYRMQLEELRDLLIEIVDINYGLDSQKHMIQQYPKLYGKEAQKAREDKMQELAIKTLAYKKLHRKIFGR